MENLFGQREQNGGSFRRVNSNDITNHRLSSNTGCKKLVNQYIDSLLEDGCLSYRHVDRKEFKVSTILDQVLTENPKFKVPAFKTNIFTSEKIHVDVSQVKFVLNQVLENALHYTEGSQQAEISLERDEQSLVLSIQDKGIGICSRESEKIFLPFFRGVDSAKFVKGIGLGLTLSKRILLNNDAEIKVESQGRGHGTSVFIIFPFQDKRLQYMKVECKETLVPKAVSC